MVPLNQVVVHFGHGPRTQRVRKSASPAEAGNGRKPVNTTHAPSGIESSAGTSWASGPPACRKAHTSKSKANCATASSLPRNPIAACALPRSMPARSCCWTAPTGSRLPKLSTQSLSKKQLIKPIRRASADIDARLFRPYLTNSDPRYHRARSGARPGIFGRRPKA